MGEARTCPFLRSGRTPCTTSATDSLVSFLWPPRRPHSSLSFTDEDGSPPPLWWARPSFHGSPSARYVGGRLAITARLAARRRTKRRLPWKSKYRIGGCETEFPETTPERPSLRLVVAASEPQAVAGRCFDHRISASVLGLVRECSFGGIYAIVTA